jgi:protein-tyrosine-phosphatase
VSSAPAEILLVTDEDRVALALARELAPAGHRIALATPEPRSLAAASRWVGRAIALPDPLAGPPSAFAAAVAAAARAAPPALVLPAGDLAIAALAPAAAELRAVAPLALPPAPLVAASFDRSALLASAAAAGFAVPAARRFNNDDEAQDIAGEIDVPILVRPAARVQWGRGGRGARRRGLLVADRAAFLAAAPEMLLLGPAVAEEPLAGERWGLTVLAAAGTPLAWVQHRVRREATGRDDAPASVQTMAVDPALRAAAGALAASFALSGCMTIAFRSAGGGARFLDLTLGPDWTLALAAASGLDLARAAVAAALGTPVAIVRAEAPPGLGLTHLARDLARVQAGGPAALAAAVPGVLAAATRLLGGHERLEVERFDDPGPALYELREIGVRGGRALGRAGERARARLVHLAAGAPRRLGARHVLVLCDGNICRSPFVEHLLRARLAAAPGTAVVVESAGLRAALGHPAPPLARTAAAAAGVDLAPHRSQPVSAAQVARADLILVMDLDQRARLVAAHPAAAARVLLMARFDPDRGAAPEVPDPVFGDLPAFERVYTRLVRATERLAAALTAGR